jgi:hypothetical protein
MPVKKKAKKKAIKKRGKGVHGCGVSDFLMSGVRYLAGAKGDLFPGETHGILRMPNGENWNAQYMGPGTNVATRVRRGDPGRTNVDKASKAHDIRYSLARSNADIDMADDIMLQAVSNKPDSLFNKAQAKLIWPKRQFARLGFRFGSTYGDPKIDNDPQLKGLYETELKKLSAQGFGRRRKIR